MREFIFTIDYEWNVDPVMDVFIDIRRPFPDDASVRRDGMCCSALAGPETALEQPDDVYDDPVRVPSASTRNCKTDWTYEVIGSDPGARTVYSYGRKPATVTRFRG